MSQSITVKGTALLNPGTHDETWGLLKDFTKGHEADKEVVKDGNGNTVSVLYTDARTKVSGTFTPLAAATSTQPPKMDAASLIGSTLSFTGEAEGTAITIYIEGAELSGSQGKAPSFKIDGYYYPNVSSSGSGGRFLLPRSAFHSLKRVLPTSICIMTPHPCWRKPRNWQV